MRIEVRFGAPILPEPGLRGHAGRDALEASLREAITALLPANAPHGPRRRPLARLLTDVLNGPDDVARRRSELGER